MSATKTTVLLHLNNGSPKWWAGNPLTGEIAWGAIGKLQTRPKNGEYVRNTSAKKVREGYSLVTDLLDSRLTMSEISNAIRTCCWVPHSRLEASIRLSLADLEKGLSPSTPAVATPTPTLPGRERRSKIGKTSIESLENGAWF